ncbi:MAG: ABC transporter permease [Planctomycetes bacterium]|nr:ABC transporter permease [Planctomycetota bacterium]
MISRKTLLVARREYHENLRTKTFWVGIFFFPIVLILSIAIPSLLERTKDARRFAILDHSGWLGKEARERGAFPDMKVLFFDVRSDLLAGKEPRGPELPESERAFFKDASDQVLEDFAEGMTRAWTDEQFLAVLKAQSPVAAKIIADRGESWRTYYLNLPDAEKKRYGRSLAAGRYEFVEIEASGDDPDAAYRKALESGELFAYFVIGDDPVASSDGSRYVSNNLTDTDLKSWFARYATDAVRARRFAAEKIDAGTVAKIQAPLIFESERVSSSGEITEVSQADTALQWVPIAFVYLLWIAVFTIAQMLLTNTIEEKSNRTIEVLLSSVSPYQLMSGKIAGIALTGLTVVASWIFFFFLIIKAAVIFEFNPPFDPTPLLTHPKYLLSFVIYFLLGFLMFSALLVGIGSVCNSLKEAQNLMMPVSVVLMIPLFAMFPIVQDPNGTLAKIMSYIPLTAPFAMMNRSAADIPTSDYVISTLIILVTIVILFWAAAKVFRIGILMTGKAPRLREILRWIKAPVGSHPGTE